MPYLNIHMLQSFPAANLNRDDTGAPKDVIFGGSRRNRISSQCQKRSIRRHPAFRMQIEEAGGSLGLRTNRFIDAIAKRLTDAGNDSESSEKIAATVISLALGIKLKSDKQNQTSYLLYLGENEIEKLVNLALAHRETLERISREEKGSKKDKELEAQKKSIAKEAQAILKDRQKTDALAADIALFGRMIADKPEFNVDAAVQVAHSFGVQRSVVQTDFYTAVDDLIEESESGSGMMGIIEFDSACHYRYMNLNLEQLRHNLGTPNEDLFTATVCGFVEAAIRAIPTGMQNSFAAQTPPSYLLISLDEAPLSLANAFEKPITPTKSGIEHSAIEHLKEYTQEIRDFLGHAPIWSLEANFYDKTSLSIPEMLRRLRKMPEISPQKES